MGKCSTLMSSDHRATLLSHVIRPIAMTPVLRKSEPQTGYFGFLPLRTHFCEPLERLAKAENACPPILSGKEEAPDEFEFQFPSERKLFPLSESCSRDVLEKPSGIAYS